MSAQELIDEERDYHEEIGEDTPSYCTLSVIFAIIGIIILIII